MKNSERLGFPTFAVLGKGRPALDEFDFEVDGWLPLLPEVHLPQLNGQMLADVVQRKSATAGCLDCGVGGSLRFCLFLGMMGWLVFLPRLRMLVFGLMGCWMLTLP